MSGCVWSSASDRLQQLSRAATSRPVVGSSSSSSRGAAIRARAMMHGVALALGQRGPQVVGAVGSDRPRPASLSARSTRRGWRSGGRVAIDGRGDAGEHHLANGQAYVKPVPWIHVADRMASWANSDPPSAHPARAPCRRRGTSPPRRNRRTCSCPRRWDRAGPSVRRRTVSEMPSMICLLSRRSVTSASVEDRSHADERARSTSSALSAWVSMLNSLAMTSSTVRSVSMTNVVRLTGISLPSRPRLTPNCVGDDAVGVREQRVVELLLVGELGLLLDGVGADTHPAGPDGGELAGQIAEVAGLLGAARRHRRRVEEQHDRSVGEQSVSCPRRPVWSGSSNSATRSPRFQLLSWRRPYFCADFADWLGDRRPRPSPPRVRTSGRWPPSTGWCR